MRSVYVIFLEGLLAGTGCSRKPEPAGQQSVNPQGPSTATEELQSAVAQPEPITAPVTEPAPAPPAPIVVPAGATITGSTGQALGSKTSHAGDRFSATVVTPVSVNGKVVIPSKSEVEGTVVNAKAKGKVKGEGELELALKQISIEGRTYSIQTAVLSQTEKGKGKSRLHY